MVHSAPCQATQQGSFEQHHQQLHPRRRFARVELGMFAPKVGHGPLAQALVGALDDLSHRGIAGSLRGDLQHEEVTLAKLLQATRYEVLGHLLRHIGPAGRIHHEPLALLDDALDNGVNDGLLALEVPVDLPDAHVRRGGYLPHAGSMEPVTDHTIARRLHNLVAALQVT